VLDACDYGAIGLALHRGFWPKPAPRPLDLRPHGDLTDLFVNGEMVASVATEVAVQLILEAAISGPIATLEAIVNNSLPFTYRTAPFRRLSAAVVYFGGRNRLQVDENGAEVTIMAQAQDIPAYMTYTRAHDWSSRSRWSPGRRSWMLRSRGHGGRVGAWNPVQPSIFASVNLDELMKTR